MKKILFLSSVDFKEKSIQVIRKTPEAYRDAGWEVHYVVGRDQSKAGDYFYENVINPEGIHIYRFIIPFAGIHGMSSNRLWQAIWFRVRTLVFVIKLARRAISVSRKVQFDVIYGYEIPGVLAARLVRALGFMKRIPFVIRFQGVLHVKEWLALNQGFRKITNIEAVMALRTKSDLVVMTNDGSQGTEVLRKFNSPNKNILFVPNGVDYPVYDENKLADLRMKDYPDGNWYFISVSRLDPHKRIDRGMRIIYHLVKTLNFTNVRYTIVGGGVEHDRLKAVIESLGMGEYIRLLGPVKFTEVPYHMTCAHWLISTYTSSNVGNPLLESIRLSKPVVTLNNGDTGEWVKHNDNGLIYDVNDRTDLREEDYLCIATDIRNYCSDLAKYEVLVENTKRVAREKLWTWNERFQREISEVEKVMTAK